MFFWVEFMYGVNMFVTKNIYTLIAFLVLLSFANGDEPKGSLTFVIDDTSSMTPEITQVKEKTSDIFAAVQNSNASQIDEFIIVTFNDPGVKTRVKTNKRGLFTRALIGIQTDGGEDCPEMAMAGIQLALEESKRNSFLYVYTDASAKDYDQYANVKSLAQQKSIQVNFLLTGECDDLVEDQHTVYDHLAAVTSGQVFHIDKDDISKIIEYILANLRSKRITLLHKTYEYTRRCNNLKFTVDSKVWEILIALSASRPLYYIELKVYGPEGTEVPYQNFINTENTQIVKMQGKPGEYVIKIIDCEGITVVVSASTSVSFSHGFSPVKPSSLVETSPKPIPGKKSYLAIALTNEERDITLKTVEIWDIDDNLIPPELPLTLVDDEKQFYITNLFTPPKKTFTIAVIGFTKTNEKITRVSQTSIEYHTPQPGVFTPPTVTVLGPKEVPGDNYKSVFLNCKVTGFPEPVIWWEDESHRNITKTKAYEIAPNEYIIRLHMKVSSTLTFTCKARNTMENSDNVTVTVQTAEKAAIVTILEGSEITLYNDQPMTLNCKVEGFPEPAITWEDQYHNVLSSQINAKTPPYEYISTLHIDKVADTDSGTYICKAKNFMDDSGSIKVNVIKKTYFNVLEYPKDSTVEFGDSLELNLKIDANPPATISWYKEDTEINSNGDMEIITSPEGSSLRITSAKPSLEGKYSVIASNGHATDSNKKYEFKITVTIKEKAVIVTILEGSELTVYNEKPITLNCKVEGFPKPAITWENQHHNILPSQINAKTPPYEYISTLHIDNATDTDSGTYICKAKNFMDDSGSIKVNVIKKTFFNVLEYPKDTSVEYGKSVELNFKIDANPPAKIIWYLDGKEIRNNNDFDISFGSSVLKIKNAQPRLQGKYYVKGSNGDQQKDYEFHVTVTGTEEPKIYKRSSYTKYRGSSVDIECRIMQGKPDPVISWSFDRNFLGKFTNLKETGEIIHIDHVTNNDVGTYRCEVSNGIGIDHHEMPLYVEYPPSVKISPSKEIKSKEGERVLLACVVDGSPTPTVRWFVNKMEILGGTKYKIYRDNTLSFTGSIGDYGEYSCEASNRLKTVRAAVSVFIYEPTKIELPKESKFDNIKLRSNLTLSCKVKGHPKPKVQWFHLTLRSSVPKKISCDKNYNVILNKIQAKDGGFYRCTADNGIDKDEITYTVDVSVPVAIVLSFPMTKDLNVVEGDLNFVLTCNATGSPIPDISWRHNGAKIENDGVYKISNDGTLTVNNVVLGHSGTYTCTAQNKYNKDTINYDVLVNTFPTTNDLPLLITIIEGKRRHEMYCGLKLDSGFLVRWFKDDVLKTHGDLTLFDVTKADAGYYICRVSTPLGRSYTFPKNVIVGTAPKFITVASPTVMFKDGAEAKLDCSATGEPPPMTTWHRDYTIINVDSSQYSFRMDVNNIGHIVCNVSNAFDTIKRTFDFIAEECLMNIEKDFTARQPILIAGYKKRQWPVFKVSNGVLRMYKHEKFKLFCPNSFISYAGLNYGNDLKISCAGDSMFKVKKRVVKASEITCNQPVFPLTRKLSDSVCLGRDTKMLFVGFNVAGAPMNVFGVCINEKTNTTLYAMHSMHKAIAGTIPKHVAGYTGDTKLNFNFDEIYDCRNQLNAISPRKITSDKCCFKPRQLVNPMDVLPGISQVATYHYLNVVPQWSSCSTENWDEVERRVRSYALNSPDQILLWTGAAYSVKSNIPKINLKDKLDRELQVPQFIWRVVGDELAIIHVNIPGLTLPEAETYRLCNDICSTTPWMKSPHWYDVSKGFIYCCDVKEFRRLFNYRGYLHKN